MADQSQQPDDGPMMKVRDVAELFDVTTATVREWLKSGELRGIKIGKGHYWRIPRSAVKDLANNRHGEK